MRHAVAVLVLLTGAAAAIGAGQSRALARDAPGELAVVSSYVRTFQDESEKLADRCEALKQATLLVWRMDPDSRAKSGLKEAARSLLAKLSSPERVNDATNDRLANCAFAALAPYKPLAEIADIARPFIEKGAPSKQELAIYALLTHGGSSGFAKELIKILDLCGEESGKGQPERARMLERPIIECARALATTGVAKDRADAVRILLTALERAHATDVRRYSMRYLGDLKDPKAIAPLLEIASATYPHADLACAARALSKCGSDAGLEELRKRVANGGATELVRITIAELSLDGHRDDLPRHGRPLIPFPPGHDHRPGDPGSRTPWW